jgi:ABC-type polysaccharide/polyol phosphate transport system ATPase subunit
MSASRLHSENNNLAIDCQNVSKEFFVYKHRTQTAREWFIRVLKRQPLNIRRPIFQLQNLNLQVRPGECVALLGNNGAGKSTALRLIAGIYQPTSGTVLTTGRISAVLELGAGFHMELTGIENVALYGSITGVPKNEMHAYRERIFLFADIGEFSALPIKYYSSGMMARLALAVAICTTPDIFLLDEALAVGDESFRRKCLNRLQELRDSSTTMLLASHDMKVVRDLTERAILIDKGSIIRDGPVDEVIDAYQSGSTAD